MHRQHNQLVRDCSRLVYEGFLEYNENFSQITNRARPRFEQQDWKGHQQDIIDRVELYEKSVRGIVEALRKQLGPRVTEHALWNEMRRYFGERIKNVPDAGFMKTFFNSITRRIFKTVGIDPELEFVSPLPDEGATSDESLSLKRYPFWGSTEAVLTQILQDFAFNIPHPTIDQDVFLMARTVSNHARMFLDEFGEFIRFEFLDSVFYQSARAYLVGRIVQSGNISPLVIALRNHNNTIMVDAVLQTEEDVSVTFSYTRSYYFADPRSVIGAVRFLHSILPGKPIDELYTVLGRLRQGKTERYRSFSNHMSRTNDYFEHADGDTGLVMIVFTLPSYDLVFKIIRDKFGYPKTISRNEVINKYKLVSKHDHAGRLIGTQEFLNLEFPLNRFSKCLTEDLLDEAGKTVHIDNDKIVIDHVYIERRVRPLNLYVREENEVNATRAIIDYGQAIKDLAETNIFPGDLLLKNFGVTRHGRVVFYDYDEVALVTDCQFRDIPETDNDDDIMRAETWFHVNKNDIFPSEFIRFLSMEGKLRDKFKSVHADLLTAEYWRRIKEKHRAGEISMIVPYSRQEKFHSGQLDLLSA